MAKIEDGFNKFQYSKFDKKGGQLVIRTNDLEEFEGLVGFKIKEYMVEEAIDEALKIATPPTAAYNPPMPVNVAMTTNTALGNCAKCGAPNIIYKKSGKVGCSKFCWNKKADSGYKQY